MGTKKALVIGCGIGGPVVAMALQRAGFQPVVFEARSENADLAGSFLNLASNGLDALRTLGAHAAVMDAGFPTPRMVMWSGTGKRLGEVANGALLSGGIVSLTLRRGDLHRALREEALRRGIAIQTGKKLTGLEASADGARAQFEDGAVEEGALLVGADGLHSRVRSLLDSKGPKPRYTGQLSLGGITQQTQVAPTPNAYQMIFGKRGFFGYSVRPSGEAFWFANLAMDPEPGRHTLAETSTSGWKARLLELFRDDAGPAVSLIESTQEDLAVYPIYDMPPVPTWHQGRVVLAGDAVHATSPSSGQGASMAIEDALVLGRCLERERDFTAAFRQYESERRRRVEQVVKWSARVGSTKVPGPVGRYLRDLFMPQALKMFASENAQAWLYRHHIEWDATVTLPDRSR